MNIEVNCDRSYNLEIDEAIELFEDFPEEKMQSYLDEQLANYMFENIGSQFCLLDAKDFWHYFKTAQEL